MVTDARPVVREVDPALAADAAPVLGRHGGPQRVLPGLDPTSVSWVCADGLVAKCSRIAPFRAALLRRTQQAVHNALAPIGVTPTLHEAAYDRERRLFTALFSWHEPVGPAEAADIGATLAAAHEGLAGVTETATFPWIGFYGEQAEFGAVLPGVADPEVRELGERLLPYAARPPRADALQLVHRDLHRNNVVRAGDGIKLIDWDMAHLGRVDDDLAATVCCVVADSPDEAITADAASLVGAYRSRTGAAWADLEHPALRAAIALAGLRQGVAGWYTDEGDTSARYWPRIRQRMRIAVALLSG